MEQPVAVEYLRFLEASDRCRLTLLPANFLSDNCLSGPQHCMTVQARDCEKTGITAFTTQAMLLAHSFCLVICGVCDSCNPQQQA